MNKECKSCQGDMSNGGIHFPNKEGTIDICESCDNYMKYLENDLVKDKVKFIRKIRCEKCNFRICKINNNSICLWCLNDDIILRHRILYHPYSGKKHAYVLQNDFEYCINQLSFRSERKLDESKLTHLTKKLLNNISYNKRW